ncbi:ribokinase [Leuconostoc fallax]|uniref:Ribokinase n=1 Tax=Leuconostoc fallax TaxID=1251 RepID=A0A4R5N9N2_9LACO|nr:ribokinase [Leuconostoc fallax]MBU7455996.1 ribokinase [Leuconostoc fallax]TDG68840.1 hypothetical protein C5L23_000759 [Leuconostoc fallax]
MRNVVVIGSLNIDIVQKVPRLPRQGETLGVTDQSSNFGGKGANQAIAAQRQGSQVAMIGAIGDDDRGLAFRQLMTDEKMDDRYITTKAPHTGSATIMLEPDGHNTILVHGGANMSLTREDVRRAESVIAEADVVVAQLEVPREAIEEGFKIAKQHGVTTILNPAPVTHYIEQAIIDHTDLVVPNETEAAALAGVPATTDRKELEQVIDILHDKGFKDIVVTLGADGVYYDVKQQQGIVPIIPAKVVDTTAAGDTFIGSLAANWSSDLSIEALLTRATAASSIVVARPGAIAAIPLKREVDALLVERGLADE